MGARDMEIDNASTESMQRILRMSRQEHEQKPGAVKVSGFQSSNSNSNNFNSSSGGGGGGGAQGGGANNNNNNNNSSNNNINSGSSSGDISDINPRNLELLVSMGFTVDEVVHALRMNAYDLHSAAQYLLGGA